MQHDVSPTTRGAQLPAHTSERTTRVPSCTPQSHAAQPRAAAGSPGSPLRAPRRGGSHRLRAEVVESMVVREATAVVQDEVSVVRS